MHRIGESWEKGEGGRNHSGKQTPKPNRTWLLGTGPVPPNRTRGQATPQNGGGWAQAAHMK